MKLSREIPYFEKDLFMSFDEFVQYICNLGNHGVPIRFLLGEYFEIALKNITRVVYDYSPNDVLVQKVTFYSVDTVVCEVLLPMGKMYKKNPNREYVEVVEGIDYSNDPNKHFGEIIRVHQ